MAKAQDLAEDFIISHTKFSDIPYLDDEVWTYGYGQLVMQDGRKLYGEADRALAESQFITKTQAKFYLRFEINRIMQEIDKLVLIPLQPYQMASLISFVYDVGIGAFKTSMLLTKINSGWIEDVPTELKRWNKVDGKVNRDLSERRNDEIKLWEG